MKIAAATSFAFAAALFVAAPAFAKERMAKEHELSGADRKFITKATMGNLAAVHFGTLAVSHGSTPAVREFGRWMISTHSFANRELTSIAERLHDETPSLMKHDVEVDDAMGKLQNLTGVDFDKAYLQAQVVAHNQNEKVVAAESREGKAPLVRDYAANILPLLDEHLAQAKLLLADADGGENKGAEAMANMKAPVGGMGSKPQGNTSQAKTIQRQQSGQ